MAIWKTISTDYTRCRTRTARVFQSILLHKIIIALIVVDMIFVVIDLAYSLTHTTCGHEAAKWVEALAEVSFGITSLFLGETLLTIWAVGLRHVNPFGTLPHASLHLFDACVVISTFILEIVLHGNDRELAGLLVFLRLWRIVKLVGGIVVISGEMTEEEANEIRREVQQLKTQLLESQSEVETLRKRLPVVDPSSSPA